MLQTYDPFEISILKHNEITWKIINEKINANILLTDKNNRIYHELELNKKIAYL